MSPGLSWKVDASPFRITVYDGGREILREHSGPPAAGTRLSYKIRESGTIASLTDLVRSSSTPGGTAYTVATTESGRTATVTVSRTSLGLRVAVDFGHAATTVGTVYEAFDDHPGTHFLGAGEQRGFVDLRGQAVSTKVWSNCSSKTAPFFLSSGGYAIRFATSSIGRMAFGPVSGPGSCDLDGRACEIKAGAPVVQACFETGSLSYEIYAGTPEDAIRSYAARTGRPPLPSPEQFALMKWRDVVGGEADLSDDANRFAAAGIPLGWLIIDNPWEPCVGSLTFDAARFPDPSLTIARLHSRGIRVMMWASPVVREWCAAELYPQGAALGNESYRAIDLTDPVVAAQFGRRLETLLATGIDGFKVDRGDEVDFELETLSGGRSADYLQNVYPGLVVRSFDRAARVARGKSVPTLFRAGYMGAQSLVTGSWSGDLEGSWDGFKQAVRSAQTAGLVGYSTWGSDVGGYNSTALTPDVFIRWSQLGAISPVFEIGGIGPNATPWLLGPPAMQALKKSATLHYELFPYLYQLARNATATGVPVLRPLALQYPADERSWSADQQLLVGPTLLAAPVTGQGTTPSVYIPAGNWVDLATSVTVRDPSRSRGRRRSTSCRSTFEGAPLSPTISEPLMSGRHRGD